MSCCWQEMNSCMIWNQDNPNLHEVLVDHVLKSKKKYRKLKQPDI